MSEICYPTFADVMAAHEILIERYGGAQGFNGPDGQSLVESALARPMQKAHYEGADLVCQAASLLFGLAKNQAFRDGNKGVATATAIAFLHENGRNLIMSPADLTAFVLRCSDPDWTEEAVEAFLREHLE